MSRSQWRTGEQRVFGRVAVDVVVEQVVKAGGLSGSGAAHEADGLRALRGDHRAVGALGDAEHVRRQLLLRREERRGHPTRVALFATQSAEQARRLQPEQENIGGSVTRYYCTKA